VHEQPTYGRPAESSATRAAFSAIWSGAFIGNMPTQRPSLARSRARVSVQAFRA